MKSGTHFHFKQFSVAHDRCIHKVGTDGVLLGAWVNVENCTRILDIGTGSGVIALMLAQRTSDNTTIDAIEIEKEDAVQATENVASAPWHKRVTVHHQPVQRFFPAHRYDLIVSNPPYFINSYEPSDERRAQARHTVSLSFEELLATVKRLLEPHGRFAVVLPYQEGLQFIAQAESSSLYCMRKCGFRARKHKAIERWLLEFSFHRTFPEESEMILYEGKSEDWTEGYKMLTKEFYLKV
jgi:tRNA1Val (adenine37-N6)-methyltransferase